MAKDATKEQRKKYKRGQHPNSRKNLENGTWTAGQSGNPDGKEPGTKDRATIVKKWAYTELELVNPITQKMERATVEDDVVLSLIREARKGSVQAIKEFMDTLYGKIPDKIEGNIGIRKIQVEWLDGEQIIPGTNDGDTITDSIN